MLTLRDTHFSAVDSLEAISQMGSGRARLSEVAKKLKIFTKREGHEFTRAVTPLKINQGFNP
jgi:hypothetical protein